jgi:hypothetical protein
MGDQLPTAGWGLSWRFALLQIAILSSTASTPIAADIDGVALALWALRGPLAALQSLSIFVVIRAMNPLLIQTDVVSSMLAWALPPLVAIRVMPLIKSSDLRVVGPLWLFCAIAIICSIATNLALAVSIMKAVSLAVIAAAVLVASLRLSESELSSLGRWLRTLTVVVAALSLGTLVRPAIAHHPDTNMLQGILNHPQALGAYLAPFSAAYLSIWLFRSDRTDRRAFAIMTVLILCMLLTLSRTAALAAMFGAGMSLLGGRAPADRRVGSEAGRLLVFALLAAVILSAAALAGSQITSSISGFVMKRGEQHVSEAFVASRGGTIVSQLQNFASSPFVGHGFGVYADGVFPMGVVEVAGIPVSAPVEKGVLPSAVLEETGLIGFLFFAYMIFAIVRTPWKRAERPVIAMLFACLFVNLGEAILLSPGNIGLHVWLLIGWCLRVGMSESAPHAETHLTSEARAAISKPYANLLD